MDKGREFKSQKGARPKKNYVRAFEGIDQINAKLKKIRKRINKIQLKQKFDYLESSHLNLLC